MTSIILLNQEKKNKTSYKLNLIFNQKKFIKI